MLPFRGRDHQDAYEGSDRNVDMSVVFQVMVKGEYRNSPGSVQPKAYPPIVQLSPHRLRRRFVKVPVVPPVM